MARRIALALFFALILAAAPAAAMPFLAPLFVIGASLLGASTLVASLVGAVASIGLSFLSQALFKPPQQRQSAQATTTGIEQQQSIRQSTASRRVVYGETEVGGIWAFLHVKTYNELLFYVLLLAGHSCEELTGLKVNDELIDFADEDDWGFGQGGRYGPWTYAEKHHGSDDQEASAILLDQAPEMWTETDTLSGQTYISGHLRWDNNTITDAEGQEIWGTFPELHVRLKGYNGIYDPRTDTVGYTDNPALIVADYLTNSDWGRGVDYATGINEEALIVAANICDEEVELDEGETEKRYRCGGSFLRGEQPDQILGWLLSAMHGKAVFDGNRWTIYAAAYDTPTITLTDDDMAFPSRVTTLQSGRDTWNGVKGTFVGLENKFVEADFPAVISETYKALDGGVERINDIALPFTPTATMARRIAEIDLKRNRQEVVEEFAGKLSCFRVRTGSTILRTSERYGWDEKPFEVKRASPAVEQDGDGNPILIVRLHLQETDPSIYDPEFSIETPTDPAPNTNFPNVYPLAPAAPLNARERLELGRLPGGFKSIVRLSWGASPDAFVSAGGEYTVRYRLLEDDDWIPMGGTKSTFMDLDDLAPGHYEAEVRSRSWAGHLSEDALAVEFEVVGVAAPPARPRGLHATAGGHGTVLVCRWEQSLDVDVVSGGLCIFRYAPNGDGLATWPSAVSIGEALPGSSTECYLPLKTGRYFLKFVDAGGNYSDPTTVDVEQESSFDFFAIGSISEATDFLGEKDGVYAHEGLLRIKAAGAEDDLHHPDWPGGVIQAGAFQLGETGEYALGDPLEEFTLGRFDDPSGVYFFANMLDFIVPVHFRLTSILDSVIENVLDDFDGRSGDVDSWPSWDGEIIGQECDARVLYAKTMDDPASPAAEWSAWHRIDTAEVYARGVKAKLELYSFDPACNIAVSELGLLAERPDVLYPGS